ncbi:hypothetical protein ACEQ8H_008853 [Pleosporales sp. CAS-2024a]
MVELDKHTDARFQKAFSMANRGDLFPLNEEELAEHRGRIFGKDIWDSPVLAGKDALPLTDLPTPAQFQRIMKLQTNGKNHFRFAPSLGTASLDAGATEELLENMTNPAYSERGAIIHASCPVLDHLRSKSHGWQQDGVLGQSRFQVTIAPAGEFFDSEVDEHYRFMTLIAGTCIVIAYPPSRANTSAMQIRYEALSGSHLGPIWTALTLYHGIAIVQKAGQTLMLPPFWSSVLFVTETSVSAAHSIATADKYPQRLDLTCLSVAQLRMWPDKATEQRELTRYADSLAAHLDLCLNAKLPRFDNKNLVIDICRKWDSEIKGRFAHLLACLDDEEHCMRIRESVRQTMCTFIHARREKKPVCRLCKVRLDKVKGLRGPDDHLVSHVTEQHSVLRSGN